MSACTMIRGANAFEPLWRRLLLAPSVRMVVRFLPVVHPSAEEQADAQLYAENVRRLMAQASPYTLGRAAPAPAP